MIFPHPQARTFLTLLLAAVAVAAFALAGSTATAHAAFGTVNGKIAFSSDRRDGGYHWEIYTMRVHGSEQTRVTHDSNGAKHNLAWSPNGKKIAFDRNQEIYAISADGSGEIRLTNNPMYDSGPSWSPNGKKIAFERNGEIYVMKADGSAQTQVTSNADTETDRDPSWSPNGKKIAFTSNRIHSGRQRDFEIYTINVDGSARRRLTHPSSDYAPAWSPNSKKIVFSSDRRVFDKRDIYTMNANGTHLRLLTHSSANDEDAVWSPDGRKIAFTSGRNKASDGDLNTEIYTMNADGSGPRRLTNNSAADADPAWQSLAPRRSRRHRQR